MSSMMEMFAYDFMVRALVVGVLVALCAALIGAPLVLRRNSMIGDGLSHVGFGAFAVASVLGLAPLEFAIPVVLVASFLILRLGNRRGYGDAAIALLSVSALALGTFVVSVVGTNVDINSYLFGSVLSLGEADVVMSVILAVAVILLYLLSYNRIFAITFDESFAKSVGVRTGVYNMVFAGLCSVVVVLGMRLVGALLISGLLIFPTLSAMQIFKNFKGVVVASAVTAVATFVMGLVLSYLYATPTGATIVIVNLAVLGVCGVVGKIGK